MIDDLKLAMAFVDRGYRGVELPDVRIWKSGQRRGVTRGLKAMIKRRCAIEPMIGHMNADAIIAVLCGAGHNLRLIINQLKSNASLMLTH